MTSSSGRMDSQFTDQCEKLLPVWSWLCEPWRGAAQGGTSGARCTTCAKNVGHIFWVHLILSGTSGCHLGDLVPACKSELFLFSFIYLHSCQVAGKVLNGKGFRINRERKGENEPDHSRTLQLIVTLSYYNTLVSPSSGRMGCRTIELKTGFTSTQTKPTGDLTPDFLGSNGFK